MPDSAASVCTADAEGARPVHAVAALLGERPRPVQHRGLAGAGVALDAHHAVLRREDGGDGLLLAVCQRPLVQVLPDLAPPHQHLPQVLAGAHGTHGLALVSDRGVRGHSVAAAKRRRGVEASFPLERVDGLAGGLDRDRAGPPGERGGQQVGPCEYRLALRQVLRRPRHGMQGRIAVRRCSPVTLQLFRSPATGAWIAAPGRVLAERHVRGLFPDPRVQHMPLAGLFHHPVRREPERRRLLPPDRAKRLPVDVPLVGAGHQRRPRRQVGTAGRSPEAARAHRRLDLRAPRRERVDDGPRNTGDLEAPVRVGFLDAVAQLLQSPCQLAPVNHPGKHLPAVQRLVGHGSPLGVFALHHVGDHGVCVELGVEVARDLVAEGRRHHLLACRMDQKPRLGVLHAGLDRGGFQPGKGALHGGIVGGDRFSVAAEHRDQGHRLWGGEGQVPSRTVREGAVLLAAAEAPARAVRHGAFEDLLEDIRLDTAPEPQRLGAPAGPGAGIEVFAVPLRVVAVLFEIGHALRGRGDCSDGNDHQSQSGRRACRSRSPRDGAFGRRGSCLRPEAAPGEPRSLPSPPSVCLAVALPSQSARSLPVCRRD